MLLYCVCHHCGVGVPSWSTVLGVMMNLTRGLPFN